MVQAGINGPPDSRLVRARSGFRCDPVLRDSRWVVCEEPALLAYSRPNPSATARQSHAWPFLSITIVVSDRPSRSCARRARCYRSRRQAMPPGLGRTRQGSVPSEPGVLGRRRSSTAGIQGMRRPHLARKNRDQTQERVVRERVEQSSRGHSERQAVRDAEMKPGLAKPARPTSVSALGSQCIAMQNTAVRGFQS